MAAINKNFVIKNGIEVGENLIYGDKANLKVGIGTTVPNYTLDVRGGIGATSISVGQTITANSGIFTSFNVSGVGTITTLNATGVTATVVSSTWSQVGLGLTFTTGIATNFTVSGVGTITTLNATGVAATAIRSTWSQVGAGLTFTTGIATNFTVSGVGTITTLNATGVAATAVSSTWSQIGAGLTFTTGIATNFTVSGVGTITTLNSTGVAATAIRSTWSQVGAGLTFTTGIGTFINITGVGTIANLSSGIATVTKIHVGIATTYSETLVVSGNARVTGILTIGTGSITLNGNTDIITVGTGATIFSSGDVRLAGIITAYKFVGDGSALTGTISGVGINSDGVTIGTGVTFINFAGPGVSTVTVSAGIATINFEGGGGSSSIINKETFNVGAAGTNLLTLVQPYTSGNIDIYINGLKLSPGDFSEASSNTVGLTTSAAFGDTIDAVSFATVGSFSNIGLVVQQDSVGIGTSVSTFNFVGGATTYLNRGNNILDIYLSQGRIDKQSFSVGVAGTTLLTLSSPYNTGKIDIYRNGIRLASGDFSETSPTTIGLTTAANYGDIIEVQSFVASVNSQYYSLLDNLKVTGITTLGSSNGIGTVTIGIGNTALYVEGNARITGILSIGQGTVTIDGSTNRITVGSGITINGNTGIISASQVFAGGVNLATVASGSITPTSLTIAGEGATAVTINSSGINVTGVVTATSFVGSGANLTGISSVSFATTSFGLSGTPNLNVGITTVTQLGINTTTIPTKLYVQGNAASNIVTLTDGATITPDFTLGNNFQVTIAASRTIANPTGVTTGQSGVIFIQENGTGGYTVGWGTSWDFASSTAPTLITTASALNALPYFARSTTSIVVGSVISGIGTL
jgi:hypothetical protein